MIKIFLLNYFLKLPTPVYVPTVRHEMYMRLVNSACLLVVAFFPAACGFCFACWKYCEGYFDHYWPRRWSFCIKYTIVKVHPPGNEQSRLPSPLASSSRSEDLAIQNDDDRVSIYAIGVKLGDLSWMLHRSLDKTMWSTTNLILQSSRTIEPAKRTSITCRYSEQTVGKTTWAK